MTVKLSGLPRPAENVTSLPATITTDPPVDSTAALLVMSCPITTIDPETVSPAPPIVIGAVLEPENEMAAVFAVVSNAVRKAGLTGPVKPSVDSMRLPLVSVAVPLKVMPS